MLRTLTRSSTDVEHIARRFYSCFKTVRTTFLNHIHGFDTNFRTNSEIASERELFASLLLNRLMFLYFLQHKGLLDGDTSYLPNRLRLMQECQSHDTSYGTSFYRDFLLHLFSSKSEDAGAVSYPPTVHDLCGSISFPGKDFLTIHNVEGHNPTIQIDNEAFEHLFTFFNTYHWELHDTPSHDHQLTPNILGYISEHYIHGEQTGAYYTKEDVTDYIARNTIIPYLFDAVKHCFPLAFQEGADLWQPLQENPDRYIYPSAGNTSCLQDESGRENRQHQARYQELRARLVTGQITSIDDFISYNLDICRFARDTIHNIRDAKLLRTFYEQLCQATILDPTCGSGAFLLAALHILAPLYEACIDAMQAICKGNNAPSDFCETLKLIQQHPNRRYFVLKMIISNNLYGVDIMEEATEVCQLRLFLALAASLEQSADSESLPQLSRHIRTGNSLVGFTHPDPGQCTIQQRPELDATLARAYDVSSAENKEFERWRASHQPFHWCIEFEQVIQRGGFHVIIGNPPYVEYNKKRFPYTLRNFTTLPCANLYTCIVERSHQLLSPYGRHGMILPLAAFSTRNMLPFIDGFQRWFPSSWLSFYHFRPTMLFSGSKVASIPTTIHLTSNQMPVKRFSTHLTKWSSKHRDLLFSHLSYSQITVPRDPLNRHYYPKFGSSIENDLMTKVLPHKTIRDYLAHTTNQNSMFYRSAGGLYWKIFVNFPWPYQTTSNKQCAFQEPYERDVFVALFNSSLFWWYYTVTFDSFNLKDYMLFGFRFTYPEDTNTIAALRLLCQQLMDDYCRNARHLKRGGTGSYTIYAKKSKPIIDEIDRVLAQHYSFSDEELDFIVNYDIKYRLGHE